MAKKIVTASLLLFVAAAVAVIATQEWRKGRALEATSQGEVAHELQLPADGLVVFYLHGDRRCATCNKLEAYSQEAIEEGFPQELADGSLSWRVANTDQAEHAHFVTDFELTNKALVVAEYKGGELVRWQNLALIWHLVDEKAGFLKYVRDAVHDFRLET